MRRVLITGGTGYIGARLVRSLRAAGVAVRATARSDAAGDVLTGLGAEARRWSLDDDAMPPALLEGVDTVFHLAVGRRVHDPATGATRRADAANLAHGTRALVEAFAASPARRLVITSSAAVYGRIWGEVDEDAPLRPDSPYGRARVAAEAACRASLATCPERLTVARLTETFGPGSAGQRGVLSGIATGRFRLIGTGRVLHHLSVVDDAVAGLIACGRSDAAAGETLHIGSPARSLRAFVAAASAALGRPVRDTPWAEAPATALLTRMRRVPRLRGAMPGLHAALDYQLRPRGFPIARSLDRLGPYATADFDDAVAASARLVAEDPERA